MSFVDATQPLLQFGFLVGGAKPLRSTTGTGHVPTGFDAEIIDGQYYPDRPLPISYRPLENPYASSVEVVTGFSDSYGTNAPPFGAVANLYANQNKFFAAVQAGDDTSNGLNIRA